MFIQDPIHGYIRLDDMEEDLLNLRDFQRLRRIRQLGFTSLIYPSTTHTRFEHSLGATYLAGRFADNLELSEDDRKHLRAAALLHDIGHGPYSHTSEMVLKKHGISHEDFSAEKIQSSAMRSVLQDHDVDPDRVVKMINGKTELGQIIAGDIDVDRMDYLMRDAHYSGVAHGTIDDETIMRGAEMHDGKLVFHSKFKAALEGLLTARYLMVPTVYRHSGVERAEKMMERAIQELVESGEIELDDLRDMDDIDLKYRLRHTDNDRAHYLNDRLDRRDIFKSALTWDETDLPREGLKELAKNIDDEKEIEQKIADEAGVPVKKVLLDKPSIPGPREITVDVMRNGEIVALDDSSLVTDATYSSEWELVKLNLCCPSEDRDAVHDAGKKVLKDYKDILASFL